MDPFESTDEEFYSDFGAPAPSDEELLMLLAQSRATGNEPLRRLLKCYRVLRRITSDSIAYLEARNGAQAIEAVQVLSLAKFLSRSGPA